MSNAPRAKRKHRRREPVEQVQRDAYVHAVGLVYKALADEQDIGLFGTPPKDGRALPALKIAHAALKWATKGASMQTGGCFASMKRLARDAGIGRATAFRHIASLREVSQCFVIVSGRTRYRATNVFYPALDGAVLHPRAPGYDAVALAAAMEAHGGVASPSISGAARDVPAVEPAQQPRHRERPRLEDDRLTLLLDSVGQPGLPQGHMAAPLSAADRAGIMALPSTILNQLLKDYAETIERRRANPDHHFERDLFEKWVRKLQGKPPQY